MITGYFDPVYGAPLPMVEVGLFLPQITQTWVPVNFLLDTGADRTTLHPQDALIRVGIPRGALADPSRWPRQVPMGGVGGSSQCYIWPAYYGFRHDDGSEQVIPGEILIAQLTSDNQTLESLLGWDVLQHFEIRLDWASRQIVLE